MSPAQYEPHDPSYSKSIQSSLSPAFRKPIYGTAPLDMSCLVRTRAGLKPTPGPGEYKTEKIHVNQRLFHGSSSSFKSKTARTFLITPERIRKSTSSAIAESVEKPIEKDIDLGEPVLTSSFKASTRDHHNQPRKGPGPGQYDITKSLIVEKKK